MKTAAVLYVAFLVGWPGWVRRMGFKRVGRRTGGFAGAGPAR